MLAQRIALQASHAEPLRDDIEGFIVSRMDCNDPVRQVTLDITCLLDPGNGPATRSKAVTVPPDRRQTGAMEAGVTTTCRT